MSLKRILKSALRGTSRPAYEPLITVSISKSAILHNIGEFKKLTNRPVAPVLKSNAYGHGLVDVARIVDGIHPPFIVVDSLFEATALRAEGIRSDILIIGYTRAKDIVSNKLRNIAFTITSLQALIALAELLLEDQADVVIHLKIDTGMRRQGILIDEIDQAIAIIKRTSGIILEGACSHFADADTLTSEYTSNQIKLWNEIVIKFKIEKEKFASLKHFHVSNSAGHAFEGSIDATVSRLGIGR
jgi:alanine racemase